MPWTLTHDGITKTFAAWGLKNLRRSHASQVVSVASFEQSGSVVGTMDIFVSGGGTGSGGPYGHVDEVTLIAADGVKVVSPVRLFFASDTGLTSEVTFAIKSSGGYYPLSVVSASVSVGEALPASYSQLMQWDLNLTGNSLVAKITGAIPTGGDLTCFAIAEQG